MKAGDLFRTAGSNLLRRKGRTLLTLVGVIIGVGALVLMISLGMGLERQLLRSFESEEVLRTITVTRVEGKADGEIRMGPMGHFGRLLQISREEIGAIERLDGVDFARPDVLLILSADIPLTRPVKGRQTVVADWIQFRGTHERDREFLKGTLLRGRMWEPGERGCLIPSNLLHLRFGLKIEDLALDQPLAIKFKPRKNEPAPPAETLNIRILGIVDSERLGMRGGQIVLPQEQALELWDLTQGGGMLPYEKDAFPAVEVRTKGTEDVARVKTQLKNMGYEALAATDVVKLIGDAFLIVKAFLACIGAIGLLVSMFGIANTMAMSVLERTREIGIMKALGGRNRDVRRLFLVEAAWIGLSGGIVGLVGGWLLGIGLNYAAMRILELPGKTSLFYVSPWLAAGSLAFAVLVSVIAGVVPAVRASRMDPVAALRYE